MDFDSLCQKTGAKSSDCIFLKSNPEQGCQIHGNRLFCSMSCNYATRILLPLFAYLSLFILTSCGESKPDDEFILKGTITNYPVGKQVRFDQWHPDRLVGIDSVFLKEDGAFHFQTKGEKGAFYQIRLDNNYSFPVFPGFDELEITADYNDLRNWTVTGSHETSMLKDFLGKRGVLFETYRQQKQQLKMTPKGQFPEKWKEAEKATDVALIEFRTFLREYIDTVSIPEFRVFAAFSMNMDANHYFLEGVYKRLKEELPGHGYTNTLRAQLDMLANPFVRIEPQDIVGEGPEGQEIHLKDEVGKMTLVYFWAGYCAYSRQENQIFKELYDQYKDQGFSIFGLSIDEDPQVWRNAIAADGLNWPSQIWLREGWEAQLFADWEVPSVPTTFLLDHRGVIMIKNIRGEELKADMDKLLAQYGPK